MGVLKVKVGADWLPVSQGFDMTPAGYVGHVALSAGQTGFLTTAADITGLSVTFNADPTHTYKTTCVTHFQQTAAAGYASLVIANAANTQLDGHSLSMQANEIGTLMVVLVESGLSGVQTRKGRFLTSAGGANIFGGADYHPTIIVEDITTVVPMSAATATAWMTATLGNSWVNYDTVNYNPAQYRKIGDKVELRGMIANGNVTLPAFTLPVGFRPPKYHYISTVANNAIGVCRIGPDGLVTPTIGSTAWFSLDNIIFSVTA